MTFGLRLTYTFGGMLYGACLAAGAIIAADLTFPATTLIAFGGSGLGWMIGLSASGAWR